jgi:hypothetical protein
MIEHRTNLEIYEYQTTVRQNGIDIYVCLTMKCMKYVSNINTT